MNKKIKILIISDYRNTIAVRPEAEIFIRLQSHGSTDVTIMTYENAEYVKKFRDVGIKIIPFHPEKKLDRKAVNFIHQELINGQYDILHLFNSKAIINGLKAAKKINVKVILFRGVSVNVHWYDPTVYFKYLHPRVDKIICVARPVKEHIDKNPFFDKSKTVVILKGHSLEWYNNVNPADLTQLNIPNDAFVVVNVADARPMKGIPYLIRSSDHLPEDLPIHYLLIGRNMDSEEYTKLINESPYKNNFHVMGYTKDPLPYVAASNIFVLASISSEGLNKTTIEAMGLGIAPVVTDIPENEDLVVNEKNGLIVPKKDPEAIAKAILRLYNDRSLCKLFGQRSKEHIQGHLSIDKTVEKFLELYKEILS